MDKIDARKFALIALGVFILSEVFFSILSLIMRGQPLSRIVWANAIMTIFIRWIPPFVIAYWIEQRDARALGLAIKREKYATYAIYAIVGLILPVFFVGPNNNLLIEFIEQVVYIGLLEEFFYRGYLMNRLCVWVGGARGLFLASFIFGLAHVTSRVADHGFGILDRALVAGAQAFFGGLIFGLIYLRAKNIWPSAIAHVFGNMYFGQLVETL